MADTGWGSSIYPSKMDKTNRRIVISFTDAAGRKEKVFYWNNDSNLLMDIGRINITKEIHTRTHEIVREVVKVVKKKSSGDNCNGCSGY